MTTALASSGALDGARPATVRSVAERQGRVELVDVLKLLALLQMVNGHTLDAVMDDALRRGPIFDRYVYLRGLVSVAFMLCAGLGGPNGQTLALAHHGARAGTASALLGVATFLFGPVLAPLAAGLGGTNAMTMAVTMTIAAAVAAATAWVFVRPAARA